MNAHRLQTAARLANIRAFHVMELAKQARELELAGCSIIHMGIGEPDFTAAEPVVRAAADAMRRGVTQYTGALGIRPLREAIARYYQTTYGLDIAPERIIVTAGASAALLLACAVLVEIGGEVLMPDPSYPCNRHFVAAFDGAAKLVPSGPEVRFQLTAAQVDANWSERTQGVLLASPSNPTGTSILPDELQRIVQTVRAQGGFSIVDEIYQGLSYDQAPVSALSFGDDVVTINSFSKYFNMTGWRLGWLVVPPSMLAAVEKLAQNFFICASTLAQQAALACFTPESMAIFEQRKSEFKRRRDYLVPELQRLGFTIPVLPDGAFYVYADCSRFSDDADAFTRDVLQATGVVMTPGLDFGTQDVQRYIRVSYATSMENLQEAVHRLETYLK